MPCSVQVHGWVNVQQVAMGLQVGKPPLPRERGNERAAAVAGAEGGEACGPPPPPCHRGGMRMRLKAGCGRDGPQGARQPGAPPAPHLSGGVHQSTASASTIAPSARRRKASPACPTSASSSSGSRLA